MKTVYLDNGSSSFPKAPDVAAAMCQYINDIGVNVGRGGYEAAFTAGQRVIDTRKKLCAMLGASSPKHIIFTSGATLSMNLVLLGLLRAGNHVLTSNMEHNAVMRPLFALEKKGVTYDKIPCNNNGELMVDVIESMIKNETKAIVMTHASNVCGTIMPIAEVAKICKKHGLYFIVDAAQTAGVFPISLTEDGIDAVIFAGHKALLGPSGIGGFAISQRLADALEPLVCGGTGSRSDSLSMPSFLPDKFEPGTANLPGIFGLHAALCFIETTGSQAIQLHERRLAAMLIDGVSQYAQIRVVGVAGNQMRAPVVSLDFIGQDNADIAFRLEQEFGILTRCGLHCAPEAHKTLGTYPHGTVRFVPGYATTKEDIAYVLDCIRKISK